MHDLPDDGRDAIVPELEHGLCTAASLTTRTERCTCLPADDYAAWREVMDGDDMGSAVMYRKLLLEQVDPLGLLPHRLIQDPRLPATRQRIPPSSPRRDP